MLLLEQRDHILGFLDGPDLRIVSRLNKEHRKAVLSYLDHAFGHVPRDLRQVYIFFKDELRSAKWTRQFLDAPRNPVSTRRAKFGKYGPSAVMVPFGDSLLLAMQKHGSLKRILKQKEDPEETPQVAEWVIAETAERDAERKRRNRKIRQENIAKVDVARHSDNRIMAQIHKMQHFPLREQLYAPDFAVQIGRAFYHPPPSTRNRKSTESEMAERRAKLPVRYAEVVQNALKCKDEKDAESSSADGLQKLCDEIKETTSERLKLIRRVDPREETSAFWAVLDSKLDQHVTAEAHIQDIIALHFYVNKN